MALNLGIAGSGPTSSTTLSYTPILPTNKSKYIQYKIIINLLIQWLYRDITVEELLSVFS